MINIIPDNSLEEEETFFLALKASRIEDFDGNLTREHLRTPNPYNTYINKGLPPGPICNPGLDSLKAALYPADTSYLYFVSKNNGTHQFSSTISDHNRAVDTYQKGGKSAGARRRRSPN